MKIKAAQHFEELLSFLQHHHRVTALEQRNRIKERKKENKLAGTL